MMYDETHTNIIKDILTNKRFKVNKFPALGLNALMAFFPYYGRDY